MYKVKRVEFFDFSISLIFCIFLCLGILFYPKESISGALQALSACGTVLIPSLFPFMMLSQFFVYSGVASKISPVFSMVTKKLFKLPPVAGITIFLSLTGGYPVGSRAIKALYEQKEINIDEARRMAYFCVGGGPAFIMGTVGVLLLRNYTVGIVIFASQFLVAIIIGIFMSFGKDKYNNDSNKLAKVNYKPFAEALTQSCVDASQGMIVMCALVIIFGSVLSLLNAVGFINFIAQILEFFGVSSSNAHIIPSAIFEVTNACQAGARLGASTEIIAFAVGFGGLSVHFQIFSSYSEIGINKLKFVLCRIIQGILTAIFTYILFIFLPLKQQTAVIFGNNVEAINSPSIFAAVALVIMCCVFAVGCRKENKYI